MNYTVIKLHPLNRVHWLERAYAEEYVVYYHVVGQMAQKGMVCDINPNGTVVVAAVTPETVVIPKHIPEGMTNNPAFDLNEDGSFKLTTISALAVRHVLFPR